MKLTRREILKHGSAFCLATLLGCSGKTMVSGNVREKEFEIFTAPHSPWQPYFSLAKPVVSIVKVNEKQSEGRAVGYAVAKALDLIGGAGQITKGKENILIKPNLLCQASSDTTKPHVVEALTVLLKKAGKNVRIGEASVASWHNVRVFVRGGVCTTRDHEFLQDIQEAVFKTLGYADLSRRLDVGLVNLHVGRMAKLSLPDNFVFRDICIHEDLYRADMICSVPMMKTHTFSGVTLALKNVGIGCYPGLVYGSVRSMVHRKASEVEPTGTSSAVIDMVRANKIGLCVIDATTAMQGQGPSVAGGGKLVRMNLILAGTHPLATDMVAASVMGFHPREIDTFTWAAKAGMKPANLSDIEIVGEAPEAVRKPFARAKLVPYTQISDWYGPPC